MDYILQWGYGDSTALSLILPSIPERILLWRTTNASRRSRKVNPKVTLLQMVAAGHQSPCMAGMIQVNHLEEMWRNKSMLEHSNCIFTWPVLRWRMILHSQFQESLPKCNYHIKGSVPFFIYFFFPFPSEWDNYLYVWSLIEKVQKQQALTGKRLVSLPIPFWIIWFEDEYVISDVLNWRHVISRMKAIV